MASITGWFDEWTRKITQELLRQRQRRSNLPSSAPIKILNPEKTKGQLPGGQIVDLVVKGSVYNQYAQGFKIGATKYLIYNKNAIQDHVDATGFVPYVIHIDFPDIYVFDVKKNLWAFAPLPDGFVSTLNVNTLDANFTPSGKHLIVWGYYNEGDVSQKLTQNVVAQWVYFKNFRIVTDPDNLDPTSTEGLFEVTEVVENTGSLSSGLLEPPPAPVPDWDDATFDNGYPGFTTHIDFADDPLFNEELSGAFFIDDEPNVFNNFNPLANSPDNIHTIRATYYEYTDSEGDVQPALDLFGNFTLSNQKANYKRVTGVQGNCSFGTNAYTSTYGSGSSSGYWRDPARVAGRVTTVAGVVYTGTPSLLQLYEESPPFTPPPSEVSNMFGTDGLSGPACPGTVSVPGTGALDTSDTEATEAKIGIPFDPTISTTVSYNGGSTLTQAGQSNIRVKVRTNVYKSLFYLQTHNGVFNSSVAKSITVDADGNETTTGTLVTYTTNPSTASPEAFRSFTDPVIGKVRAAAEVGELGFAETHLVPEYLNIPGTNIQSIINSALGTVIYSNIFTKDSGSVDGLDEVGAIIVVDSLRVITVSIVTEVTGEVEAGNTVYKWKFQKWSYNAQTDRFTAGVSKTFLIPTKWTELFPPFIYQSIPPSVFMLRG